MTPFTLVAMLVAGSPSLPAESFGAVSLEVAPTPVVTASQKQIAGQFLLDSAKIIAAMAHPTLDVDEIEGIIDGDNIVITIKYQPSGILGNHYTTRVSYGLSGAGIASAKVTFDDAFISAFTGLELIKEVAAELASEARKSQDEDVKDAARLLEVALSQDASGTQLHLLILKVLWVVDEARGKFRDAA